MPNYDYHCKACGKDFEEFQKMSAPALDTCPYCKQKGVQRKVGGGIGISMNSSSSAIGPSGGCCPCGKSQKGCGS